MKRDSVTRQTSAAVSDGWMEGGAFLNSILAGTLLGLAGDHLFGTEPWLVVTGVVLGSYAGFMQIWAMLKRQPGVVRDR